MNNFSSQGTQSLLKPHLPCGIDIWTFSSLYYLCYPCGWRKSLTSFWRHCWGLNTVFGSYANYLTLPQQFPQLPLQVQQVPQNPFVQPAAEPDLGAIKEIVEELYRLGLMQIVYPEFYKPYPKMIERKNPYPRGYRILDFSLFSGEDGQSTIEHVARFTVQCGDLANYENFYHFKLRLFPNSLIGATFTWYTTLPRNSIQSWQEMERQFLTKFFRVEPEVCITELSRVT